MDERQNTTLVSTRGWGSRNVDQPPPPPAAAEQHERIIFIIISLLLLGLARLRLHSEQGFELSTPSLDEECNRIIIHHHVHGRFGNYQTLRLCDVYLSIYTLQRRDVRVSCVSRRRSNFVSNMWRNPVTQGWPQALSHALLQSSTVPLTRIDWFVTLLLAPRWYRPIRQRHW